MDVRVKWAGDVKFIGVSGSGHAVAIDGPPDEGGENYGIRPMELMLLGVAGCSSFDVVKILRKGRQRVESCDVEVHATRADAVPAVFESIHLHFRVRGHDLSPTRVGRAIELSATKYCSASIMMARAGVAVTHDFEVTEPRLAADEQNP